MLDQFEIVKLVEEQIKEKVQAEMQTLLEDQSWTEIVEQQLMRFAQDRIAAKFASSEYTPKILETVERSVQKLFNDGKIADFKELIDENKLNQLLDARVTPLIDKYIEERFSNPSWLDKVQSVSNHAATERLNKNLMSIDIETTIARVVEEKMKQGLEISSQKPQLTIMDDVVVNEHEFVTDRITVVSDATIEKSLTVQDLIVRGRVNTDNISWSELTTKITQEVTDNVKEETLSLMIDGVLKKASKKGIDFDNVTIDGQKLIEGDSLGPSILNSKLTTVGTLKELTVTGPTKLNETVTVNRGKIGINTENPNMALDIWDNEVQIILGKKKQDTGYIGLGRKGTLEIGTSEAAITVEPDGKTVIKELMIGRNNISWDRQIPNYSGQKGDIVFNMDPTSENDTGWQCLGGFRWRIF